MSMSIRYADSQEVVATSGPLIMRIVERAPTEVGNIEEMFMLIEELRREQPKVAIMAVIHAGAPMPTPSSLSYMMSAIPRLNGATIMFVMLGLGFWALKTKCALLSLAQIAGLRVPIATDLDSAAASLCRRTPNLDVATVITTYESAARKMLIGAHPGSGSILT